MSRNRPVRVGNPLLLAMLALALPGYSDGVLGQQSSAVPHGLYFGLALPAGMFGATMRKTVDNTAPNTLVPDPRRGRIFHDEVSGDAPAFGIALVVGYRLPLGGGSWYLDGDLGTGWKNGTAEARFAGVGVSPERRQLGESWPDSWSLMKDVNYEATVRLGGGPGALRSRDLSLYVLAGVRVAAMRFTNHYTGCFTPEPCDQSRFRSGRENRDMTFTAWKSGLGLEKQVNEGFAIRAEASYSVYGREEWTTPFEDVGVMVRSSMDANEVGLTVGMLLRF